MVGYSGQPCSRRLNSVQSLPWRKSLDRNNPSVQDGDKRDMVKNMLLESTSAWQSLFTTSAVASAVVPRSRLSLASLDEMTPCSNAFLGVFLSDQNIAARRPLWADTSVFCGISLRPLQLACHPRLGLTRQVQLCTQHSHRHLADAASGGTKSVDHGRGRGSDCFFRSVQTRLWAGRGLKPVPTLVARAACYSALCSTRVRLS